MDLCGSNSRTEIFDQANIHGMDWVGSGWDWLSWIWDWSWGWGWGCKQ